MKINGTNITMIRGDSETIIVSCQNPDKSDHPFGPGDTVTLSVRRVMSDRGYILQKVVSEFDEGRAIINILPADTERIHIDNGRETYKYDIQLTRADRTVTTIVPASNFVIEEDVTHD